MFFTSTDGVQLYYELRGQGEPVIIVHGAGGAGLLFDEVAEALSDSFQVVTLDLRGLGRSDRVESVGPSTWCDDIIGIADHLGFERFHLFGCSLGARICARLAQRETDRVLSLTVDAPLVSVAKGANDALNDRFLNPDNPSEEDYGRWVKCHGETWKAAIQFYGRARNQADLQEYLTVEPFLDQLTLPTLITRGDIDDTIHPLFHTTTWHKAHPDNSWLWISPGCRFSTGMFNPIAHSNIFKRFVKHLNNK